MKFHKMQQSIILECWLNSYHPSNLLFVGWFGGVILSDIWKSVLVCF